MQSAGEVETGRGKAGLRVKDWGRSLGGHEQERATSRKTRKEGRKVG